MGFIITDNEDETINIKVEFDLDSWEVVKHIMEIIDDEVYI